MVSRKGISADPKKKNIYIYIYALRDVKGSRGFLGLMGYYKKFVKK